MRMRFMQDVYVYVFCGFGGRHANAVFSTAERADDWVRKHELSGLLTRYKLDTPAFDENMSCGKLKSIEIAIRQGEDARIHIQRYVDGSWHRHYFYGVSDESLGYLEASDRWDRENDLPPNS